MKDSQLKAELEATSSLVLAGYREHWIDANQQVQIAQLKEWIDTRNHSLSATARLAVSKFLDAELDYRTIGVRGIGRTTSQFPRFGSKYRYQIAPLDEQKRKGLTDAMREVIASGYLFCFYILEFALNGSPRLEVTDPEILYREWIPTVFCNRTALGFYENCTRDLANGNQKQIEFVRSLWILGAGNSTFNQMRLCDISTKDEYVSALIEIYFDAGISLAICECLTPAIPPIGDTENSTQELVDQVLSTVRSPIGVAVSQGITSRFSLGVLAVLLLLGAFLITNQLNKPTTSTAPSQPITLGQEPEGPLVRPTDVRVKGTLNPDGSYKREPHFRTAPDWDKDNNMSTKGNVNDYTGKPGTK